MARSVRILHLLHAEADFQSEQCVDALTRGLGGDFELCTRRLGAGTLSAVAASALALHRAAPRSFDVVHAWGTPALVAATLGGHVPVVFTPLPGASAAGIRWARAASLHRRIETVCPTATARRMHVERGVPIEHCHLVRPGVDFARVRRRRDVALRARLGISPEDRVLLAVGESTRAACHREAVWAATILHLLDPRYRLLLWGRGPMANAAVRLARQLERLNILIVAEEILGRCDFYDLIPAADVALVTAVGAVATLPISIAMAAALPIVSTVTYTTSELLEDRHTALMLPPGRPRQFAQRVLDLDADARLQWSISDMARTEAFEFVPQSRFLEDFRTLYQRVAAGEPVSLPQRSAGAGLQFHGRS